MVLCPIDVSPKTPSETLSAWDAIERKQRQPANDWWLIAQPDHAALSGALAESIDSPDLPALEEDAIQAIALHDDGWAIFDSTVQMNAKRPASFLDVATGNFLQAWRGSIERAQQVSALAGLMVSEHFCRIARARPQSSQPLIDEFLQQETERQNQLLHQRSTTAEEMNVLVDVLQFCDLLSLYLCCGSQAGIEFPQTFNGHTIRLRREGRLCRLEPAILGEGTSMAVPARKFSNFQHSESIPVLLS
jgi:hypothetical protein